MTVLPLLEGVHASYRFLPFLLAILVPALASACGHADSPSNANACPVPPGSIKPCDVGLGSESVSVVLEQPDILVGQTMVVRGVLTKDESALFVAEPGDGGGRIAVRPRGACPVDAHRQSVLVRGIFRTHGADSYLLDSARLCVP